MYPSGKLYEASAHICEKQKEKLGFLKTISILLGVRKKNKDSAFSTKITLCAFYMTDVTSKNKTFSSLLSEDFFINWWCFKDITHDSDFNYAYDYTIFSYNEFLTDKLY